MRLFIPTVAALFASAATSHGQSLTSRLDSAVHAAELKGFSGVVRVEREGRVLLDKGYGLADRAARVPFTPATVVQIGSNTKDFTAVAILQLHAAKRLSLSDSIGKYFRGAPADKRNITIRELMNHRAGFPLGIGGDFEAFDRAKLLDSAMKTTLLFQPGTRESYSNTGYSLLAAIIEQVAGTTYDRYVHDAILVPAGLTRTGLLLPGFKASDLAHGYSPAGRDEGTMLAKPHATDGPWWNLRGNGGMLSTAGDMAAFYTALFESDKLLDPATRALRFNPAEPVGLAGSDGTNFFLYDRFPPARTEIIIASTNAAMKAPLVRRAIGEVLGLPSLGGGPDEQLAHRPGGTAPSGEVARLLNGLVAAINSGDTGKLREFITANFTQAADGPTVDERMERFTRVHENLGAIAVESMEAYPDGPAEMRVKTASQERALLKVNLTGGTPVRIQSVQVMLGG